jgi:hypothetical protein
MTPAQVDALEKFLANNGFEYYDYDEEVGVVIYRFSVGDWTMEVAYGDECYYCLYNDVTEESNCEEFTKMSEVMTEYYKLVLANATTG